MTEEKKTLTPREKLDESMAKLEQILKEKGFDEKITTQALTFTKYAIRQIEKAPKLRQNEMFSNLEELFRLNILEPVSRIEDIVDHEAATTSINSVLNGGNQLISNYLSDQGSFEARATRKKPVNKGK